MLLFPLRRFAPSPKGDDAIAAGRPLLGVSGQGRADTDGLALFEARIIQCTKRQRCASGKARSCITTRHNCGYAAQHIACLLLFQ